jgi:hypothetical protein
MNQSITLVPAAGFSIRSFAVPQDPGGGYNHVIANLPVCRRGYAVFIAVLHCY